MRRQEVIQRSLALAAVCALAVAACGDEQQSASADPTAAAAPAEPAGEREKAPEDGKPAAEAKPAANTTRLAPLLNEIDRQAFSEDARDPFTAPVREEKGPVRDDSAASDCDLQREPLGNTRAEQLKLIGLVTGTAAPRAMFLANAAPQAIIVQEGAKVGPRCTSQITDIRDNEVVIEQTSALEEERVETVIQLTNVRLAGALIE